MMYVWIVWAVEPIAVFSSEERAKDYIKSHEADDVWHCRPACINPEGVKRAEAGHRAPTKRASAQRLAHH